MKWPFKRKPSPAASPNEVVGAVTPNEPVGTAPSFQEVVDQLRDQAAPPSRPLVATNPLLKLLPIGDIIKGLFSVLKDPNGKISSKRAGAGALVVAGISFLGNGQRMEGFGCIAFAVVLFYLTKFERSPEA